MKQRILESAELSAFCMELYLIIRAGIPFQEGIALLMEEEQDKVQKQILQTVYQELERGATLADALRGTGCLPHYAVEMIAIGQSTGHMERVFYALSGYYERMAQLKQSVHNIIWYPMILLTMMLFVVLILLVKVMPIFADIFAQLGAELTPAAKILLQIGQLLGQHGLLIFVCVVGVVLIVLAAGRTEKGAAQLQQLFHRVTDGWKVRELLTASKLADALVLTLSSGMNVDEALDMAGRLMDDSAVQEKITACKRTMLIDGISFADAIQEQKLFAPMYCRMIAVGFRSGDLDAVMTETARRIANDADEALDALLNRIEPALIVVLSLLVGLILLSVMLPLMGIMTAIG